MRKKAVFDSRVCRDCGTPFIPSGPSQRFCKECAQMRDSERKAAWVKKTFPNRKPKHRCTDPCCVCGGKFACHFDGKPYCNKHYLAMKNTGSPYGKPRTSKNTYVISGDTAILQTTKGVIFRVDVSDLEKVLKYTWCLNRQGYLTANIRKKLVRLHRYLLEPPDDKFVDHIDGDPTNNKRSNLRICSQTENARNTKIQKNNKTGYTGIRKTKDGMFNARITANRKEIHIGNYPTLKQAVAARKEAEKRHFAEFAASNSRVEQMSDVENQRKED